MKLIPFFIITLFNTVVFANVIITFSGDLNASVVPSDKKGSDKVFNSVRKIMKNDDFTIVNLECPISDQGKAMENKKFTFRAKPAVAKILHDNGIDAVSIANNHALDFGKDAFLDTLKNLEKNNIIFAGGGINANKTINPSIKIKTTTINFFAASRVLPDTNWVATNNRAGLLSAYNPDKLIADIKNARKNDKNFIVAYIHWGEEKAVKPSKIQTKLAHHRTFAHTHPIA
jgi:poly-gamma-glutamate synthesis protein (capsule biosynthesis protein)